MRSTKCLLFVALCVFLFYEFSPVVEVSAQGCNTDCNDWAGKACRWGVCIPNYTKRGLCYTLRDRDCARRAFEDRIGASGLTITAVVAVAKNRIQSLKAPVTKLITTARTKVRTAVKNVVNTNVNKIKSSVLTQWNASKAKIQSMAVSAIYAAVPMLNVARYAALAIALSQSISNFMEVRKLIDTLIRVTRGSGSAILTWVKNSASSYLNNLQRNVDAIFDPLLKNPSAALLNVQSTVKPIKELLFAPINVVRNFVEEMVRRVQETEEFFDRIKSNMESQLVSVVDSTLTQIVADMSESILLAMTGLPS